MTTPSIFLLCARHWLSRLLFFLLLGVPLLEAGAQETMVAIANKALDVDRTTIKKVYRDELSGFRVFELANESQQNSFALTYTGVSAKDLEFMQNLATFAGRALPPKIVDSPEEMIRIVNKTPNGIGYVPASFVTSDVKIIP